MDSAPILAGVRILTGVSLMFAAYLLVLPYFTRPEDFFVKRLRPAPDLEMTHARLITRAFLGGLLSVGAIALGTALILGEVSGYLLRLSLASMLVVGSFIGIGAYLYFRLWRYQEMTPEELAASGNRSRPVFTKREASNRSFGPLHIGLILIALPAMWAAFILASLLSDVFR